MLVHWIWLATRPGLNDRLKRMLLDAFQDPEDIFFADPKAWRSVEGMTGEAAEALEDKDLQPARKILDECYRKDIRLCTYRDAAYPSRLKNIADPPVLLYYKGQLPDMDAAPVIAVVGTRKASAYGLKTATRMGYQISRCGGLLVSGLAEGVDGAAMKGALTAGGRVIGVLGCGADVVYPAFHRSLYLDTEQNGCLLTEFPPGTPPMRWNFPKRNRVISGLSNGVLVVEAPQKSGSLITARQAADQGRDVFVVPGNIDVPTFAGSNGLLREGAIAVSSGWDILSEYEALYPDKIHPDGAPTRVTGTPEPETVSLEQAEKSTPKVAQKAISPGKKQNSDKNKQIKPIDNGGNSPYIDQEAAQSALTEAEQSLIAPLRQGACLLDALIADSGLPAGEVLSMLTMLEIKGVVKQLPGRRVTLKQN
ncbi:MAG: DNA-processing protein DprA [Firmicutes bacterium]|nr:DNA-processing protein DprA [Bacillota bacterium]